MPFTNPIWLWGLSGLLIPIGIHLLSRKESRIIMIGSIRHIETSNTKQSVNLRLNELLLLAIRCFLITLLVLLLSGLHFSYNNRESWLLIERGMEERKEFTSLRDSLQNNGFKVKFLEVGFPEIDSEDKKIKVNYWGLLEKLNSLPVDKIVVLSYNNVERFKGKRISIPSNVTWITTDPTPIKFPATAILSANDSITVREGNSSVNETYFVTANYKSTPSQRYFKLGTDSVLIHNPDTLNVTFVTDSEFNYDKQILQASLRSIEEVVPSVFNIKEVLPDQWNPDEQTDWLVWLTSNQSPQYLNTNSILFGEIETTNSNILKREAIPGKLRWTITQRLNEKIALQEKLPLQLAFILLSKESTDILVNSMDRRVQPETLLWSNESNSIKTQSKVVTSGHTAQFLAILIFILLLTERLTALRRNQ